MRGLKKSVKIIKVIEIINNNDKNEVKEHLSFCWPIYADETDKQKFYFNEDNTLMIERVGKTKVFLYTVLR